VTTAAVCCRWCSCTEEDPCKLETNEPCILNVQTLACNAPKCVLAQIAANKKLARRLAEERRQLVTPIAQRFLERRRREREARKSKSRNHRRVA
jgi:hypothetical protein